MWWWQIEAVVYIVDVLGPRRETGNTVEVSSGNFMTAHVILSKHLEGKNSLFHFWFFWGVLACFLGGFL